MGSVGTEYGVVLDKDITYSYLSEPWQFQLGEGSLAVIPLDRHALLHELCELPVDPVWTFSSSPLFSLVSTFFPWTWQRPKVV